MYDDDPGEYEEQGWQDYISPLLHRQTYLNLAYLVLAFPLGVTYFSVLITGWSLGFSLLVILIGVPILLLVIEGAEWIVRLERMLSNLLLSTDIPVNPHRKRADGMAARFRQLLTDSLFWRGQGYLLARFGFGIAALVVLSLAWSIPVALMLLPFVPAEVAIGSAEPTLLSGPAQLVGFLIGLALMPLSARVSNWMADWWRVFTVKMLSDHSSYSSYAEMEKAKRVAIPDYDADSWDDEVWEDEPETPYLETAKRRKTLAELLGEVEPEQDQASGR